MQKMKVDLHNHTTYSDGVLSPSLLIDRAIKNHVDIFAITDHDSVFGCDEIVNLCKDKNVKVIKGMELSTEYKGESIHIITLFKNNIIPNGMLEFSIKNKERRKARAIKMMENIRDIYHVKINLDKLLKGNIITRANMMRNIAEENNISYAEAAFYTSKDSKAYIPSTKMSVSEGLDLAHQAGSIAIFAHPCLVKNRSIVEDLIKLGFDGIEVRYPSNKNDESYFLNLAKKYNLFISAGSDCHGDDTHADIGTSTLNEEEFRPLAKALNFKI
jgi:predicted metal-dependent phosphoesterase TrpH